MRIYSPDSAVKIAKSGLEVSLDLKYRLPKGDYAIFRLILEVTHGGQVFVAGFGFSQDSPTATDPKGFFYSQHSKSIEGLFRQRMLERLEAD